MRAPLAPMAPAQCKLMLASSYPRQHQQADIGQQSRRRSELSISSSSKGWL